MYNLTLKQREILQWIVQKVREGYLDEEFYFAYLANGDIRFMGRGAKDTSNHPFISEGVLGALMASGVILVNWSDKSIVHCTLLGEAYEAVDSNFDEAQDKMKSPAGSAVTNVSGGIIFNGGQSDIGGDAVGRDKNIYNIGSNATVNFVNGEPPNNPPSVPDIQEQDSEGKLIDL
jgi:hypothetical protein